MKCSFPHGIKIKPDGINELDPCLYETIETHRNVTVEVRRCKRCGHIDIAWIRQSNTESEVQEDGGAENVHHEDCGQ